MLPAWGYHVSGEFGWASLYFLGFGAGMGCATWLGPAILRRRGAGFLATLAMGVASLALLVLAAASPPTILAWRVAGVACLGAGAGLLLTALACGIVPAYSLDPAGTLNLMGSSLVLGSAVLCLLVSGTFYVYTVPSILIFLALIPGFLTLRWIAHPQSWVIDPCFLQPAVEQEVVENFRIPAAILSALVLFFQAGNEWTLGGWLPVYLIQKLGMSPASALLLLALYWVSLLAGRGVAQFFLHRFPHGWLLRASVGTALLGTLALARTRHPAGAAVALLFVGGGFACVYPLMLEKVGRRFPWPHLTLFRAVFALSVLGAALGPASLGWMAAFWGIKVLPIIPVGGMLVVALLLLALHVEARLSGNSQTG